MCSRAVRRPASWPSHRCTARAAPQRDPPTTTTTPPPLLTHRRQAVRSKVARVLGLLAATERAITTAEARAEALSRRAAARGGARAQLDAPPTGAPGGDGVGTGGGGGLVAARSGSRAARAAGSRQAAAAGGAALAACLPWEWAGAGACQEDIQVRGQGAACLPAGAVQSAAWFRAAAARMGVMPWRLPGCMPAMPSPPPHPAHTHTHTQTYILIHTYTHPAWTTLAPGRQAACRPPHGPPRAAAGAPRRDAAAGEPAGARAGRAAEPRGRSHDRRRRGGALRRAWGGALPGLATRH